MDSYKLENFSKFLKEQIEYYPIKSNINDFIKKHPIYENKDEDNTKTLNEYKK